MPLRYWTNGTIHNVFSNRRECYDFIIQMLNEAAGDPIRTAGIWRVIATEGLRTEDPQDFYRYYTDVYDCCEIYRALIRRLGVPGNEAAVYQEAREGGFVLEFHSFMEWELEHAEWELEHALMYPNEPWRGCYLHKQSRRLPAGLTAEEELAGYLEWSKAFNLV